MYSFNQKPEHEAQLVPWRDKWIANAFRTGLLTPEERERVTVAIRGLYTAAGLKEPRVIFVPSPFVASFAAGFAAALWHLQTNAVKKEESTQAPSAESSVTSWELGCDLQEMAVLAHKIDPENAKFLLACAASSWNMRNGGNQWSGWVSHLSFFRHVAKLDLDYSKWDHYEVAAIAGPRYMHPEFCMVSEPPLELHVDDRNRAHCETGPYCRWADGSRMWAWHGILLPGWIVERPQDITVEKIKAEKNLEIQRVMIERYGPSRYMLDSGAEVIDMDALTIQGAAPRALVKDASDQVWFIGTDGSTARVYHMAAPATVKTCREAHEALCGFEESRIIAQS